MATRRPGLRTARRVQALPAVAATGFAAVLVMAGAAPAIAAPRDAVRSATAGHRAVRDGAPAVASPGWLAGTLAVSIGGEQASGGAAAGLAVRVGAPGACTDDLALLGLAAASCADPARALDIPVQPGAVILPCPDQARPKICRDQASAQWPDPAAAWPTCGCQRRPSLGPAPFTPVLPTALPPVPLTPPATQAQPSCGCQHPSGGSVPVAPASSLSLPAAPVQPSCGCQHVPSGSSVPVAPASSLSLPAALVQPSCGCQHPSPSGVKPATQLPAPASTQVAPTAGHTPGGRPSATAAPRLLGSASATSSPHPAAPAQVSGLSPGILPITGFDLEGVAEVAAALIVVGGGSLLASRLGRRRSRPSSPSRGRHSSRHRRPGRPS